MSPKKPTLKAGQSAQSLSPGGNLPRTPTFKRTSRKPMPRGSPASVEDNEAVLFLWVCLRHHNGGPHVDYAAVAKDLDITKNAAYKRYNRLKGLCEAADKAQKEELRSKVNKDADNGSADEHKDSEEDLEESSEEVDIKKEVDIDEDI